MRIVWVSFLYLVSEILVHIVVINIFRRLCSNSEKLIEPYLGRIFINFILEKNLLTQAALKRNIFNMYNKKNRFRYTCLVGLSLENDSQSNFAKNIARSFISIRYSSFTLVCWILNGRDFWINQVVIIFMFLED